MRSVVVLPQPDGPSSVTSVPAAMVKRDVAHGGDVAVALGDVAEFDRCGFHAFAHAALAPNCAMPASAPAVRRPSRRSPTSRWMSQITTSISTISTEL